MASALPRPTNADADCFALLDDAGATAEKPRSRLYADLKATLYCHHADALPALLADMTQALAQGQHAVGVFHYELGAQLQGIADWPGQPPVLATILIFSTCTHLSAEEVNVWLAQADDAAPSGFARLKASVDEAGYGEAVKTVRRYIEAGDTYQANLTFPLSFTAYGAPLALYRKLRARQAVPYGALLRLPDGQSILSLAPELFVAKEDSTLTARPMKGTAAASGQPAEDQRRSQALATQAKERAENLMIVDLLRNDLGRVAQLGTVKVPALFDVTRFGDVLQMTSTVQAQCRTDVSLADLFMALYPCGSITGAPKRRTMQILRELETAPRGVYTGAIGWFDAGRVGQQVGDFTLSVPIRTLVLQPPGPDGLREGKMSVGAGIVHDSKPQEEYAECLLKATFLTALPAGFTLFETLYASRLHGCRHVTLHLARLCASADFFGFRYDLAQIRQQLDAACAAFNHDQPARMKLSLFQSGAITIQCALLPALDQPVQLLLAAPVMQSDNVFLRHKTSLRSLYDAAWQNAEAHGAFDAIFFNQDGTVTEGGRSTIFIKKNGHWLTPPLAAGVLPGIMRSLLLADPALQAKEANLQQSDLREAQEVLACNALRGALKAHINWQIPPLLL